MTTFNSYELEHINALKKFGYCVQSYSSTPPGSEREFPHVRISKDDKLIGVLYHADSMINPIFLDVFPPKRYSSFQEALDKLIPEYELPSSSCDSIEKNNPQKKTLDDDLLSVNGTISETPKFREIFSRKRKSNSDYIFKA